MRPYLSVIIPCYKVEKYLKRSLDALLSQNFAGLELVCVNDGSPDNCLKILREYESRFPGRIKVIDQENQGVWKARKRGIEAAAGEYIGFADPDDCVRPGYAVKLYGAAKAYDADIACCGFDRIDAETGKGHSREMTKFPYEYFNICEEPGLMLEVNAALWNKIFRAELLKNMEEFINIPKVLDDMVFASLIYMNAKDIVFVKESCISYMVRKDSVTGSLNTGHIPGVYDAMRELRGIYERERPALLTYLEASAFLHLGISMMYMISKSGGAVLKKAIRENTAFLNEEFPGWKTSPYVTRSYVRGHKGANRKLRTVHQLYKLNLERPFLYVYGVITDRMGVNIKW